jgi:hypothetical protein
MGRHLAPMPALGLTASSRGRDSAEQAMVTVPYAAAIAPEARGHEQLIDRTR